MYRKLAKRLDVRLPTLLYCHDDEVNVQFVMLLEDLSDRRRGEPDGA